MAAGSPGGDAVLYTAAGNAFGTENSNIDLVSLKSGISKTLIRGGYCGRILPSGHLVYAHHGALYAARFDSQRLEIRGQPERVLDDLEGDSLGGAGRYAFPSDPAVASAFVYASGKTKAPTWYLAVMDASGNAERLISSASVLMFPRVSPDGTKVAYVEEDGIAVYDLGRRTTTRVAPGSNASPVWAPDSQHIAYTIGRALYWTRSDGSVEPARVTDSLHSWSLGRYRLMVDGWPTRTWARIRARTFGLLHWTPRIPIGRKPGRHSHSCKPDANELGPVFSPDARWIAYSTDETGEPRIEVRPFPPKPGRWAISERAGFLPMWSRTEHVLFYETWGPRIMAVRYSVTGGSFVPERVQSWSDRRLSSPFGADIAPDGKRFFVVESVREKTPEPPATPVMLLNFFDELKRRLP